jgi:hypothetical protein
LSAASDGREGAAGRPEGALAATRGRVKGPG